MLLVMGSINLQVLSWVLTIKTREPSGLVGYIYLFIGGGGGETYVPMEIAGCLIAPCSVYKGICCRGPMPGKLL